MISLTKEERRAVACRIFEALCKQYPDRYIAFVESTESAGLTADVAQSAGGAATIAGASPERSRD